MPRISDKLPLPAEGKPIYELLQPFGWGGIEQIADKYMVIDLILACEPTLLTAQQVREHLTSRAIEAVGTLEDVGYHIVTVRIEITDVPIEGKLRVEVTNA